MQIITTDYDEKIELSSGAVRAIGTILSETDVEEGDTLLIFQWRVRLEDKDGKNIIEKEYE